MLTTDPKTSSSASNGESSAEAAVASATQAAGQPPALAEQLKALQFNKPSLDDDPSQQAWRRLLLVLMATAIGVTVFLVQTGAIFNDDILTVESLTIESDLSAAIVLDTSGFILAENQVQIDPQTPGVLAKLPIAEGDIVKEGDLLGQLDDSERLIDVDSAKAGVALARAQLKELQAGALPAEVKQAKAALKQSQVRGDLAKSELGRAEEIKDAISKKEYQTVRANYLESQAVIQQNEHRLAMLQSGPRDATVEAAKAEVERAEAVLKKAQHWVDRTRITAPISGVVVELKHRIGETIRPDVLTAGFCILADLSKLEIEVEVPERDLLKIQVGQPCRIEPEAFPDRYYGGRVSRVLPMANRQRGVVQFRVVIEEPEGRLLPNMNCRVAILTSGSPVNPDDQLYVPEETIHNGEDGPYLFVEDGTQARIRPVTLGEKTDRGVVIKQGLFPGETVLFPHELLDDGDVIETLARGQSPDETS